ncbi:MAG: GNAT family N-acetyltransferase [Acidimicrobiia bacterium]|nr:GNAT family N-acetyltransferase [Acidimicrobiia bacterium]
MRVVRFTNQYELVAPLYDIGADDLRARDERQGQSLQRWFAIDDGVPVGAFLTWLRPDDRMFLMFKVTDPRSYRPLSNVAVDVLGRSVSTVCEDAETDHLAALRDAGFRIETTSDRFVIPFDAILPRVARAWVPSGYVIRSVADLDEDRAFELDNKVRNLVPGTDGWYGDREWFGEELRSQEFDPSAYLIAVEEATDTYAGLIRVWRNLDGPRLGLVAVRPDHRVRSLAAALLKQGLQAASEWGFNTLTTETSPQNRNTYPGLIRMGLQPVGRFHQLIRP